jgi:hypothetical protein
VGLGGVEPRPGRVAFKPAGGMPKRIAAANALHIRQEEALKLSAHRGQINLAKNAGSDLKRLPSACIDPAVTTRL